LTARGRIIWLWVGLWIPVLTLQIRFSIYFFRIFFFFFAFGCNRYSRGCWLLLKFIDLCEGIINF
jgi:hypothetical protein